MAMRSSQVRYTVGAYVLSPHGVLLLWHAGLDAWVPAGGDIRLADGELPHEAALRQVRQEINLKAQILETDGAESHNFDGVRALPRPQFMQELSGRRGTRYVDLVYFCVSEEGRPTLDYHQARAFHWFTQVDLDRFPLRTHVRHYASLALGAYTHTLAP